MITTIIRAVGKTVTVEVKGVQGTGCRALTAELEGKLGVTLATEDTDEARRPDPDVNVETSQ